MSFNDLKITTYQDSVSALPDYPSDAGITAAQLKAVFDGRTDKEIKQKFNTLIDELITKFGLVEVGIADAVEGHNQQEDAHEKIILPMREQISKILLELLSMNIAIEGKADAGITETQLSALDLFISGTTNELHDHTGAKNNPHEVTAAQIGLGNVDNTRDSEKVVAKAYNSDYATFADESGNTERDYLGNVIHEHYATKDEVGNVDLSEYYTKGEIDYFRIADEINMERHVGVRIDESLGDIETALDELHEYAVSLAGGEN